jgi:competence protein ComEA
MLAWLERNPFLVIALAGLLLLAGLAARDGLRSREEPVLILREGALEPGTPIRVHVAGAVASPGVYALVGGDRVEDAVAAAGGATAGADMDAINLARRLRDGEQILIEGPEAPAVPAAVLTPGQPLDLNAATLEQLDALPGIGEAYSRRIVDSRTVDGPFASVDEVLERGLVPARTLEGIRAMVTVSTP